MRAYNRGSTGPPGASAFLREGEGMGHYDIGGQLVRRDDPRFDALLAAVHGKLPRPRCLCRRPGIDMYVAKAGSQHLLKRMPDSGSAHARSCPSYAAPAALSGAGEVMGSAIQADPVAGTVSIKIDFALSTGARGARASTRTPGGQADTVRSKGTRLSLRALLHYLWNEAGFHRWTPAMEGKRLWYVVRKYVLLAAEDKYIRGAPLSERLYVPEVFSREASVALAERRRKFFSRGSEKDYLLLLGEVKEISSARFGKKMLIKHAPDCAFLLREDIARTMEQRFATELALWSVYREVRLLTLATFSLSKSGLPTVEALTLMPVTNQWLPFEDGNDKRLVDALVAAQRRFEKGLRYNLPREKPLACAILLDTPEPVAMYVAAAEATAEGDALDALRHESALDSWIWKPSQGDMPPLPIPS